MRTHIAGRPVTLRSVERRVHDLDERVRRAEGGAPEGDWLADTARVAEAFWIAREVLAWCVVALIVVALVLWLRS